MTSILSAFLAIRLFGDFYYYLEEAPIYYLPVFYRAESIPLASMSISILLSSYFLRNKVNLRTLKVYDITGLLGLFVSAYFIGMNIVDNGLGLLKSAFVSNILFLCSIASLYCGRKIKNTLFSFAGVAALMISIIRIVWFNMLEFNPLYTSQKIEGILLLNSL